MLLKVCLIELGMFNLNQLETQKNYRNLWMCKLPGGKMIRYIMNDIQRSEQAFRIMDLGVPGWLIG